MYFAFIIFLQTLDEINISAIIVVESEPLKRNLLTYPTHTGMDIIDFCKGAFVSIGYTWN